MRQTQFTIYRDGIEFEDDMRKPILEVKEFALALVKHWAALATGGVIIAGVWLYKDVLGHTVWENLNVWLAFVFVVYASFLAWRDLRWALTKAESEINRVNSLLDDRDERKKRKERSEKIKATLAGYLDAARVLQNKCIEEPASPEESVNAWNREVDDFLMLVGTVYQVRFRNQSGISPVTRTRMYTDTHRRAWEFLHWKMVRLDEMLKEEMEMKPTQFS